MKSCPTCNSSSGLREIIYGMPDGPERPLIHLRLLPQVGSEAVVQLQRQVRFFLSSTSFLHLISLRTFWLNGSYFLGELAFHTGDFSFLCCRFCFCFIYRDLTLN